MVVYDDQDVVIKNYKLTLKYTDSWWVDLRCLQNAPDAPGILEVNNSIKCLRDISAYGGALMTDSDPSRNYGTGGGCVQIGHGFERSETYMPPADPPRINLTAENYHTLYITAGSSKPNGIDAVLADMKLKNLTATGSITVGSNVVMSKEGNNLKFSLPTGETLQIGQDNYGVGFTTNGYSFNFNKAIYIDGGVYPKQSGTKYCGYSDRYWNSVYTGTLYYKNAEMFGCSKELSDQVVEPRFKSTDEAEAFLRHETTKAWRHIKYAESGKMVCTCGKEGDYPCPEHEAEWQEKYCHNTGDMIEASGQLVVKILDEIKELRNTVDKLQTKLGDAA